MAISFIGQAQAAAATVTIPAATQVGDIMIIFAYRNTTTAPTLPAGWTSIFTQSANGNSMRMGYKFAVGSDTSGTWTNANVLQCAVYRGVSGIGGSGSTTNASAATTTVSGIGSMTVTDGSSWAVSGAGSLQTTSMAAIGSTVQRGTTQAGTTSMALIGDSNGGVASWAQHTSAVGTNAAGAGGSVELLASRMKFAETGGDSTFDLKLWSNPDITGASPAPSVVSDFVNGTHLRSTNPGTGVVGMSAVFADAGSRVSFYLYIQTLPGANDTIWVDAQTGFSATGPFRMRLTSAGIIQLTNGTVQIGSNGSTLSVGQWYRISIAWGITSTSVNTIKTWVNGVSDITISNASLGSTAGVDMVLGNASGDGTASYRFSDIYIDSNTSVTDPGNVWVTAKRPLSNGSANGFTTQIGAGGSGYGTGHAPQVNERALSTTNGWSLNTASAITEEYSIEGKPTGDIDISGATIIDYMGWIYAASTLSETCKIILSGISTNITTVAATPTMFKVTANSSTYPAGNTDIGMTSAAVSTTYQLYEAGVVVAYIPNGPIGRDIRPLSNNLGASMNQAMNRAGVY